MRNRSRSRGGAIGAPVQTKDDGLGVGKGGFSASQSFEITDFVAAMDEYLKLAFDFMDGTGMWKVERVITGIFGGHQKRKELEFAQFADFAGSITPTEKDAFNSFLKGVTDEIEIMVKRYPQCSAVLEQIRLYQQSVHGVVPH